MIRKVRYITMCRLDILSILLLLTIFSCAPTKPERAEGMHHASLITVEQADSFTRVDIKDAWNKGRTLTTYILIPKSAPMPSRLPEGTVLRTPVGRAAVFSTVHASLMIDLGASSSIAGLCDTAYAVRPELKAMLRQGKIADLGSSMKADAERTAAIRPEVILVSAFNNADYGPVGRMDVPIIECADYMEETPLGRAEWMRFFGLLFGKSETADSLFSEVEARYDSLRAAASKAQPKPKLLAEARQPGGTWYVPGADSYLGRLYADAGADYVFSSYKGAGSVPVPLEAAYAQGHNADVWLLKYASPERLTYAAMVADFPAYKNFAPWKNRRIYACNTLATPYYETIPFHPDLLLRDVVGLLHPGVVKDYKPQFFFPLSE